VWDLVRDDRQVEADARQLRGLRRILIEELCRVDVDLTRLGLSLRAADQAGRTA